MPPPIITTQDLTIGYRLQKHAQKVIAQQLSLSLLPGELVCLIGPNGAGKSTLLRTLTGLQPPLLGTVLVEGRNVPELSPLELAQRLSIVLTERVNVGMLSVFALVALGRYPYTNWMGRLSADDRAIVEWAIRSVGAEDLRTRHVTELSDGERQKVMIARALAQQPRVMILDEPTAFLDVPRRVEIMSLLHALSNDTGTAILLSTHDLELALRTADRIWLMSSDGRLDVGAPEDLVLSGAVERVFTNERVRFDPEHGAFLIAKAQHQTVALQGNGVTGLWTRRALERAGFSVTSEAQAAVPSVKITDGDNEVNWIVRIHEEHTIYRTIYDMLRALLHDTSSDKEPSS